MNLKEINSVGMDSYLFQNKSIHYGQIVGSLKTNPHFEVPEKSYSIANYPRVNFDKHNGRICPILSSEDCIELQICSTQGFGPGDLALTFQPESLESERTELRGQRRGKGHLDHNLEDIVYLGST